MIVLRTRRALINWRKKIRGKVGFVPTMGALHEGHLSLVDRANKDSDITLVSIFVNPTQFGPNEDFSKYPRDLKRDVRLLKSRGVDAVYAPRVKDIYPEGDETSIRARPSLNKILCGPFRPGHFDGVCTVVYKLFSQTRPSSAYFGLKDFQQFEVIKAMVKDLDLEPKIVGCPILREGSGLAMSSRNEYLSSRNREAASAIYDALTNETAISAVRRRLSKLGFRIQYIEAWKGRWFVAAYFHGVRLIDNVSKKKGEKRARSQAARRLFSTDQALATGDSKRPSRV